MRQVTSIFGLPRPTRVAIGLAFAVALDTAVQVLLKFMVSRMPETVSAAAVTEFLLRERTIVIVVAVLLVWQLTNWLWVLDSADLSFALPISSLSYLSVVGVSHVLFGESVSGRKLVGLAIVLAGVWCVSRTANYGRTPEQDRP